MKIRKTTPRRQLRSRRGFTIIEMLIACSLAALLLSINAVWIYHTMRFSSRVGQRHRDHQNLTRLASDFRDDVRACEKIKIINQDEIELASPAGGAIAWTATYKITATDILLSREIAGSPASQERFSLSPNLVIRWDVSEVPETISLIVSRDPNKFPDRKSTADQKVDSTNSLSERPARPEDFVPVLELRVSPNRWTIEPAPLKPKTKTKSGTRPETKAQPAAKPERENKTQPSVPETNLEAVEEAANVTN